MTSHLLGRAGNRAALTPSWRSRGLALWTRLVLLSLWPGDQLVGDADDQTPAWLHWTRVLGTWDPGVFNLTSSPGDSKAHSRGRGIGWGRNTCGQRAVLSSTGGWALGQPGWEKREDSGVSMEAPEGRSQKGMKPVSKCAARCLRATREPWFSLDSRRR